MSQKCERLRREVLRRRSIARWLQMICFVSLFFLQDVPQMQEAKMRGDCKVAWDSFEVLV